MRYVLRIAQLGNMRRAAETLHLAQPSLSHQLKSVEREIGAPLFRRNSHGMSLTSVGEVYVKEASAVLQAFDEAVEATRRAAEGMCGRLLLAVAPGMGDVLRALLGEFFTAHEDIRVKVIGMNTCAQVTALIDGRVEAGLGYMSVRRMADPRVAHQLVHRAPVRALVCRDSGLAGSEPLGLAELAAHPLILPGREDEPGLRDRLLREFTLRGLTPRLGPTALESDVLLSMVENNQGYALSMRNADSAPEGVAFRSLDDGLRPLELALFWPVEDAAPATLKLLAVARGLSGLPAAVSAPG